MRQQNVYMGVVVEVGGEVRSGHGEERRGVERRKALEGGRRMTQSTPKGNPNKKGQECLMLNMGREYSWTEKGGTNNYMKS